MKKRNIFNRYTAMILIMITIFSLMAVRLTYIQIVNADEYIDRANTKSIRQIPQPAPRGKIFDNKGVVLATNIQSYTLTYMETDESKSKFFTTFKEVFNRLDNSIKKNDDGTLSKEQVLDEFELKVNPYRFEFKTSDEKVAKALELLFKKNRGLNDVVRIKLFKGTAENELTDEERQKIDDELLKISAEDVFNYLVVKHDLYKLLGLSSAEEKQLLQDRNNGKITDADITAKLLKKYSLEELRRYMLIKDAIYLQSFSGYKPVTVAANIDKDTAFVFEQIKSNLPGIDVTLQPLRYYPLKELGSNFIGYISKINQTNKERYEERGYDVGTDYIGTAGLESAFEDRLKGSKGGTTVRVNKQGRATEELFKLEASPGQDMILTIDSKLQAVAEKALAQRMTELQTTDRFHEKGTMDTGNATRGAAVVIDVNTGAVLAMASLPNYDPNLLAIPGKLTPELNKQFFSPDLEAFGKEYIAKMGLKNVDVGDIFPVDANVKNAVVRKDSFDIYPKPFYNYATFASIPPGSTFKPVTAVAGLEEGLITKDTLIDDVGPYTVNNYTGACWKWNEQRSSHGYLNVSKALEVSCNFFFFEVGNRLYEKSGLDTLAKYAWKLGLGVDPKSNAKPSTGLEIAEGFGKVYNDTDRRAEMAFYYRFSMASMLKSGVYYASGSSVKFTPIDIEDNPKTDSDALADAKKAVKDKVKSYILKESDRGKIYSNLRTELVPLFNNFIKALPEDKKVNYNNNDAKNMSEAVATFIAFDVMTQVITPGNVYDASIGQGINQFTPVQLANYMATLVNGGNRYKVHLVDKFIDANENVTEEYKPEVVESLNLKTTTVDAVKEGLAKVTEENGTASTSFQGLPIKTGGKTGSATYNENQESIGRTSYAVYVGFAPFDKPEIAVSVVIFDGGHGGYAAPVARAIYESYFADRIKQIEPNYVPRFDYTMNQ